LVDQPLDQRWFARHPVEVAFGLIGCWLNVERDGQLVRARIVETEAYGGMEDHASHATMYRVGRETLAQEAGRLYMQFAYGMHTMTNVVAHRPGQLGAVLL
jgi:DNA-3-methyladenine glycosylase